MYDILAFISFHPWKAYEEQLEELVIDAKSITKDNTPKKKSEKLLVKTKS